MVVGVEVIVGVDVNVATCASVHCAQCILLIFAVCWSSGVVVHALLWQAIRLYPRALLQMQRVEIQVDQPSTGCSKIQRVCLTNATKELVALCII